MLSKENYDRLNENYLYQKEPEEIGQYTFWCRNWTFKVHKSDGNAFMLDTYYNNWDSNIEVTDDNINNFKVVFDFREVRRIKDKEIDEYNHDDLYRVATDSGGMSCGGLHWVKKDAQKSIQLLIEKKRHEIESLKSSLRYAERQLEHLLSQ
jgi:hypothetical protein